MTVTSDLARTLVGVLLAALALIVALPGPAAIAATEETTTTTAPAEGGVQPAVEAPAEAADDEEQPWTARFLAPTVLILGVLGLVASVGYYLLRIRGRYRVVRG